MINYKYEQSDDYNKSINELFKIVKMLRSKDGCPWDQKLATDDVILSLIEESYEYLETADKADEIGDILINLFMLINIHLEQNDFKLNDPFVKACKKLYTRHKHVFGDIIVNNSDEAINLWNKVKQEERKNNPSNSIFDNISAMHPMDKNYKIQKRLSKVGFDFPNQEAIYNKINEEINEVKTSKTQDELELELGDLLTSVIELCRVNKINPTKALYKANNKIVNRFNKVTSIAKEKGLSIDKEHNKELNEIWDEIKT